MKSKIIAAMDAAGYFFDELESTDDNLRFLGEGGTLMQMSGWKVAKEWLEVSSLMIRMFQTVWRSSSIRSISKRIGRPY